MTRRLIPFTRTGWIAVSSTSLTCAIPATLTITLIWIGA